MERFTSENIVQTNAEQLVFGVSLSLPHGMPGAQLPIVVIIGVKKPSASKCPYFGLSVDERDENVLDRGWSGA